MSIPPYVANKAQDEREIEAFCGLLKCEGVRSYLEIGSKFGGSLWQIANSLPAGSRIVSIDMPGGTKAWTESRASLVACTEALAAKGYLTRSIWGDSKDPEVIRQAAAFAPFDAILIDADHRLPGVTADWNNYGPMGKIIAFHDIAWKRAPGFDKTPIDVPQFWESIKGDHRHQEFKFCPSGKNNGIGVLWR